MKKQEQPLQDALISFTTPKYGFKSWFELGLLLIKMFFRNRRFLRRRTAFKRRSGGVAGKFARGMQNRALTYVKKRYTKVFVAAVAEDDDVYERTVSHIHRHGALPVCEDHRRGHQDAISRRHDPRVYPSTMVPWVFEPGDNRSGNRH